MRGFVLDVSNVSTLKRHVFCGRIFVCIQALLGSKAQVLSNCNSRYYFRFCYWQLRTVLVQGYLLFK